MSPSSIRDRPEDERPRERLLRHGSDVLADAELLALLLGSGRRGVSAIELADVPFDDNLWMPIGAGAVVWLTVI